MVGDSDQTTVPPIVPSLPSLSVDLNLYLLRVRLRVAFQKRGFRRILLETWKKSLDKEDFDTKNGNIPKRESRFIQSLFHSYTSPSPSPSSSPLHFSPNVSEAMSGSNHLNGNLHFLLTHSQAIDEAATHFLLHLEVTIFTHTHTQILLSLSFISYFPQIFLTFFSLSGI